MQKKLNRKLQERANRYAMAIVLALASAESTHAVGFRLPNQDPEAIGRGNAFAATADNPSAIYYNPAGITQLPGTQVSVGAYLISAYTSFSSPNGSAHTDATPQFVPQIYATTTFTNVPISLGLGIYAPYGLGINWGDAAPFNNVAEKGSLEYVTFNPDIAWKICKSLSIAAGPTINYSDAFFQRGVNLAPVLPLSGNFTFHGNGWAPGATAGILFQPVPKWSFGVNYHSGTTVKYSGPTAQTAVPPGFGVPETVYTTAAIKFPANVAGGISFRPTPDWNLEVDLDWTDWNALKSINFNDTPFGPQSITLNYKNSMLYDVGVTRQLGKGFYASVGYIYAQNSSPSENFNPLIPDANLNLGNFGFGYKGEHWDWAIAYQFAYNGGHSVSGNSNPSVDGTYKTFNNALNASVTVKF